MANIEAMPGSWFYTLEQYKVYKYGLADATAFLYIQHMTEEFARRTEEFTAWDAVQLAKYAEENGFEDLRARAVELEGAIRHVEKTLLAAIEALEKVVGEKKRGQ